MQVNKIKNIFNSYILYINILFIFIVKKPMYIIQAIIIKLINKNIK